MLVSLASEKMVSAALKRQKVMLHAQVPNIKFTVAKLLERLVPLVDTAVADHTIKPCLQTLAEDADVDVQFFAQQALVSCEVVSAA